MEENRTVEITELPSSGDKIPIHTTLAKLDDGISHEDHPPQGRVIGALHANYNYYPVICSTCKSNEQPAH